MSLSGTVRRKTNTLSDNSLTYSLELKQDSGDGDGRYDFIILDCIDEKHQERLLDQILIAGFQLID
jgi:hypothetical protein